MSSIQIKHKLRSFYIPLALIGLALLVVAKDFMHASLRSYSFYLSESLLFGLFWLVFIPLILVIGKINKRKFHVLIPLLFSLLHLTIFSLCVFLLSALFFRQPFGFVQTFAETTAEYGIVCILVYSILHFLYRDSQKTLEKAHLHPASSKIKVVSQNTSILLDCKDILYVKSEKPYIAIVTKEKTYLHNASLKGFLEEKAGQNFIQIHKSTLINTEHLVSFVSRKNGDYDLKLSNQDIVRASRSFHSQFKPFFEAST